MLRNLVTFQKYIKIQRRQRRQRRKKEERKEKERRRKEEGKEKDMPEIFLAFVETARDDHVYAETVQK
jgi:hypothetical protein